MTYSGVELDFLPKRGGPEDMKLITPRALRPTPPVLEGKTVTDPASVRAVYQLGDFHYQFIKKSGKRSPVLRCTNPETLEQIVTKVGPDHPVIIKPLR